MPMGRRMAKFNQHVTNRVLGRLATRLPGFGVVEHVGRRSGRRYRTPINVFRAPGGYVVALTYGREAEWVKNVLAAGGCTLTTRSRTEHLVSPRLFHDERGRAVPRHVRAPLRLMGVADFLALARPDQAA
jgi:deazaflavin-dependent oxidoreductase (nitroreductase family)